jgi:hypothetical protein
MINRKRIERVAPLPASDGFGYARERSAAGHFSVTSR